jgi:hypothetical protein
MKTKTKTQFKLTNTFEIFGDPCPEYFESFEDAEIRIYELSCNLMEEFWAVGYQDVYIAVANEAECIPRSRTGMSNEIAWMDKVIENCDEKGLIEKQTLLAFMEEAFEIEEV